MQENRNPVRPELASPSLVRSIMPVGMLLLSLLALIIWKGADSISGLSPFILLGCSVLCLVLSVPYLKGYHKGLRWGMRRSAAQILPALPILIFIAVLSTTWMTGGIVPTFIHYGLQLLNPTLFLVSVCIVCGCISVMTGSSWTTVATIGVGFMGIGEVLGFSPGWIAGAVISGAYFGDKVSPLSDTTVVASSSCGVDLFTHIRYLLYTAGPSMGIAVTVFLVVGIFNVSSGNAAGDAAMLESLHSSFNVTPWVLVVPVLTLVMIGLRVNTVLTLAISALLGSVAMWLTQPGDIFTREYLLSLWSGAEFNTPDHSFNELVSTSGILGMLPTIALVTSAMVFGGVMIGTGMLHTLSSAITRRLTGRKGVIGSTIGSGLLLNAFTADQYLSLIIGANMYKDVYSRLGIERRVLSRSLEDSISVTSVLIPWNSCGLTQSAVLNISTLSYAPYCIFNYLSPVMSYIISTRMIKGATRIRKIFRRNLVENV